jgi:hypothetical protein
VAFGFFSSPVLGNCGNKCFCRFLSLLEHPGQEGKTGHSSVTHPPKGLSDCRKLFPLGGLTPYRMSMRHKKVFCSFWSLRSQLFSYLLGDAGVWTQALHLLSRHSTTVIWIFMWETHSPVQTRRMDSDKSIDSLTRSSV